MKARIAYNPAKKSATVTVFHPDNLAPQTLVVPRPLASGKKPYPWLDNTLIRNIATHFDLPLRPSHPNPDPLMNLVMHLEQCFLDDKTPYDQTVNI